MERPQDYRVKFSYTQEEMEKLLNAARGEDQDGWGRHSARSFALQLAILEIQAFGAMKHGRIDKDGNYAAGIEERMPVETPVSRQWHEQLMVQSLEEWHGSGSWVRDDNGG